MSLQAIYMSERERHAQLPQLLPRHQQALHCGHNEISQFGRLREATGTHAGGRKMIEPRGMSAQGSLCGGKNSLEAVLPRVDRGDLLRPIGKFIVDANNSAGAATDVIQNFFGDVDGDAEGGEVRGEGASCVMERPVSDAA